MTNDLLNQLNITKHQIKVFICSLLAIFLMMSLHYMGVPSPFKAKITHPSVQNKAEAASEEAMKKIRPKLQKQKNDFKLKKESRLFFPEANAEEMPANYDAASGYIVADLESGKILAEKNADQHMPIASITKIMTAIIALDLASPSEQITITDNAAAYPPSKINVVPGEKMTLEELLNASLLASANDATEAIHDGVNANYTADVFVRAMNEKAELLGLKNTHFTNPQGFDFQDNGSSPADLAILTSYALKNYPLIAQIVQKDVQYLPANEYHHENTLYNWNGLIGVYPDTVGMKIGNTNAAGYTTTVVSNRGGKKLFVALLGAPGVLERDLWSAQLLDEAYKKAFNFDPINITEEQLRAKYASWILN
jgi:D-alanyl-D-alanine carboxypeptidase